MGGPTKLLGGAAWVEACDDRVQFGPCASSSPTGMSGDNYGSGGRGGGLRACLPGHGLFLSGVLCLYRRLGDLRSSRNVDRRRGPVSHPRGERTKDLRAGTPPTTACFLFHDPALPLGGYYQVRGIPTSMLCLCVPSHAKLLTSVTKAK